MQPHRQARTHTRVRATYIIKSRKKKKESIVSAEINAGQFVFSHGTCQYEKKRGAERWPVAGILNCIRWIFADTHGGLPECSHTRRIRYRMPCNICARAHTHTHTRAYISGAVRKRDSARLFKLLNFKLSLTYAN